MPLYNVLPFRFRDFDVTPAIGAPLLGEHTEQVLLEAGFDAEEIARMTELEVLR